MPFDSAIPNKEAQHVRRWRAIARTTAPQAHGNLCVPFLDCGADAGIGGCDRRQLRAGGVDLSDGRRSPRPTRPLNGPPEGKITMAKPSILVDRRTFMTGRLGKERVVPPPEGEIASILVQ